MKYILPGALLLLSIFGMEESEAASRCHNCVYQRQDSKLHGSPECRGSPSSTPSDACPSGSDWKCGTLETGEVGDDDFVYERGCVSSVACQAGKEFLLNGVKKDVSYTCCDADNCNHGNQVMTSLWILLSVAMITTVILS